MRYLITGKSGQLARAFIRRLEADGADFIAEEKDKLNITDERLVREAVSAYRPSVIINCAAYNHVDKAEEEPEIAVKVNSIGPAILAAAAKKSGAVLVHYGTDYIFDGSKETGLYTEEDSPNPLNEYGKSKLMGERKISEETDDFIIFRMSWVFGHGKQNFIAKLMEWTRKNDYLKISCDEFSVPTYTETAVDLTLKALHRGLRGIYHLTNSGYCSRYEWARTVLSAAGINKFIRPVSMDSFHLPAKRPKFSAMSNRKISGHLGISIPEWEDVVKRFISEGRGTA